MSPLMQIGETDRDRADFCRRFKTDAAKFLHNNRIVRHSAYRNTLSAAHAPARTNCDPRGCGRFVRKAVRNGVKGGPGRLPKRRLLRPRSWPYLRKLREAVQGQKRKWATPDSRSKPWWSATVKAWRCRRRAGCLPQVPCRPADA